MTDRRIQSFDGCAIHLRDEGRADAPAVLFSHAIGGTLGMWDAQVQPFGERFRVVRYDSRGHGGSDVGGGEHSIEMLGTDALAVMDALGIGQAHFVGLSQGGMTGMWLAAHAPDRIGKLVLANTTAHIPARDMLNGWIRTALSEGLDSIAPPTMNMWLSARFKEANPARTQELVETFRTMSPQGFAGSCAVLRDSDRREDLADIRAPTLVIAGVEDGPMGAAAAQALVDAIAGARRADIPDAAHLSPIENPEAFNKAVLDFLG
jgi:3-oxoadipate enol-lactonase